MPPKRPPTKEEQIRAEYFERWSAVERIASGKSASRTKEYKRTEKIRIREDICKKYKVSTQELKVLVPL